MKLKLKNGDEIELGGKDYRVVDEHLREVMDKTTEERLDSLEKEVEGLKNRPIGIITIPQLYPVPYYPHPWWPQPYYPTWPTWTGGTGTADPLPYGTHWDEKIEAWTTYTMLS